MSTSIGAIFDTAVLTTAHDPELRTLADALLKRRSANVAYYFIDDEAALKLMRAERRVDRARQTEFEWCALYPVPVTGFTTVARRYGPGARNVIVLGTAERPTDPVAGVDSALASWQLQVAAIYLGEKVLLFPHPKAGESPKDLTAVYLAGGLLAVLEAAGNPPLDVLMLNPRQQDLADYNRGQLLESIITGTFAP